MTWISKRSAGAATPGCQERKREQDAHGLSYLFLCSASCPLPCPDAADVDDNGNLDISDAISLLSHLFLGGRAPQPPGLTTCGPDPTLDELQGCAYPGGSCP